MSLRDFRVVVAIGFAYAYHINPDITVHDSWPGQNNTKLTSPKTNTVLQYDTTSSDPKSWTVNYWGFPALAEEPARRTRRHASNSSTIKNLPVELFKLHLADNLSHYEKPYLPEGLDYQKAITDYLAKMKPLIEEILTKRWPGIKFTQVRFVFTIPAEWKPYTLGILQDCIYDAGFTEKRQSNNNLEFTTEPEAAALYTMGKLEEHKIKTGSSFMVVDCGGGTVDLTTRNLLPDSKLSEITERTGDLCGSTYVDREFIIFLEKKLGLASMEEFRREHYGQYQYLIHRFFCPRVKFGFQGDRHDFRNIDLDIERICPALMKCVKDENIIEDMEEEEWLIEITFNDVLAMFDPIVDKILKLIRNQLASPKQRKKCSAIFLVGGFAESPYLVKRVQETFGSVASTITVPQNPITAVLRGAVLFGLNKASVATRVLTMNYGIRIYPLWRSGVDPKKRKTADGRIYKFNCLAARGREVAADEPCSGTYYPIYPDQTTIRFNVYATPKNGTRFCDETGINKIGELEIGLPDIEHGIDRPVEFSLMFGELLITATARNKNTGRIYTAKFAYVRDNSYFEATV
ncbi:18835_t:CDS:2 [Funneliformis geosporum]|uniref:18835_t:CDS:1 n=1 Tax=Funneliformis geosporum TaxID=1117311 RepID=A0A9W4WZA8_9GLOM|nr:18835_t:CDS:2 [Funneliformis geosporum]